MDMSKYAEPLPTEIEQIVDEARADVGQGPAKRPPAEGIADMEERVHYHTTLLAGLRLQPSSPRIVELIAHSELQLKEAASRKLEYETQLRGQN